MKSQAARVRRGEEGFTLVELTFTAGVMTVGLVMLMGSVITVSQQSRITDVTVAATHFNTSVLETLHGRFDEDILTFNEDNEEFEVNDNGEVYIENLGYCTVHVWAMLPDANGTLQKTALPMTEEEIAQVTNMPNPIEIQVELLYDGGGPEGSEHKYSASTLVIY